MQKSSFKKAVTPSKDSETSETATDNFKYTLNSTTAIKSMAMINESSTNNMLAASSNTLNIANLNNTCSLNNNNIISSSINSN